ncbi:hypothetical protein [Paenibacillus hemerocallicola]|uniref:hypothetical protein n=1 Tax=Paenibacillus hemerocallicola TaxID=1172614 RepID=UPI00159EC195|nr:hypothetical protein [Paenibacillus hemerocallicola]
MHQPFRIVVRLTNVRGDKAAGSKTFIEEIVPAGKIEIAVWTSADRVYVVPGNTELPF